MPRTLTQPRMFRSSSNSRPQYRPSSAALPRKQDLELAVITSTTLQVPTFDRKSVRHAIRYYKKMSYHRSVVLEGVRRCALRNRHYWYEAMKQLTSEMDRSPTIGEILDRINIRQAQRAQGEGANLLWQKRHILLYLRYSCDAQSFLAIIVGASTCRSGGGFQSRHDMFPGGIEAARLIE